MATGSSPSPLDRARDIAARLTPLQKIVLGAVVLTVVAGSLVLSRSNGSAAMTVLFTDLSAADAASVVDELNGRGVGYELTDAGRTVMVPKDDVYNLRVDLAGQGLPASNEGYALLDSQGITTSEFRQRVDYQRALEGELAKTVSALDGVRSATVHLALPEESVFVDEPATPTASVLVTAMGNGAVTDDEVQAIVHLVSSSVKDMRPQDVTVVGSNGTVLSDIGGAAGGASGTTRTKVEREIEQTIATQLSAMLVRMTGPNKVAVTVSADVDLDETQSTSEDFQPIGEGEGATGQVLAEKTTVEKYGEAAAQTDTGVLGPDGAVVEPDPATVDVGENGYLKDDAEVQYALDRTVQQTVKVPGEITRLNVAVLIDESAVAPEQLAEIQTMIATAAGIDVDRGDQVTITRMPFDNSATEEAEALAVAEASAQSKEQMMGLIRTGVIVLVIVIALFLAYRSARSARKVTAIPINLGEIGVVQRPGQQLGLEASPRFETPALPSGPRLPSPEEELQSIAEQRPQEIANVLRIWLDESKARR